MLTLLSIKRLIIKLERRLLYLISTATATATDILYFKQQLKQLRYIILVENIDSVVLKKGLIKIEKYIKRLNELVCCTSISLSLTNEEGDTDLVFPVGVLNISGTYLGIASNISEYIALWNANASNTAVGTIISGTGTAFIVEPVDPSGLPFNLYGLEFYTMTSTSANMVVHVSDNDIIAYNAVAVRGSTGTNTLSSTLNEYNGVWGSNMNTAIQIRRVTCTGATAGTTIQILHSRVSERIGATATTPYSSFGGVLPQACKTFAVRGANTVDFVSNVVNWANLQSIEYYSIMNLGGTPYSIANASFYYQAPSSTIGLVLSDLLGNSFTNIATFGWVTEVNLPNLERLEIRSNGAPGNLVADSAAWFSTMPKINKRFGIINNNGGTSNATDSDAAWNAVGTALSGITALSPATIRIEDTTAVTAASLTSRNNLIAAGWSLSFT